MSDILIKKLVNFGLSEKEAMIYLALLESEVATAFEAAKHSGVNRSSAYVVLESLKKKGLVGVSDDKSVRRYVVSSPEILLQVAHIAAKKHEEIKNELESILPELKAVYKNTGHRPKVRIFNGVEGLINALTECLQNREKIIRAFSSGENIMNLVGDFIGLWAQKRVGLGIELRGIYVNNKATRAMMDTLPELYKIVYVSPKNYPSPVDMVIFDDKVGYLVVEGNKITSIFVEAKEIGAAMKGVFDLAFEEAKRKGGRLEKEP